MEQQRELINAKERLTAAAVRLLAGDRTACGEADEAMASVLEFRKAAGNDRPDVGD